MIRVFTVVGARPQFVKAAMFSRSVAAHNKEAGEIRIVEELIHTGQHYDYNMSQSFFEEMGIPEPAVNLAAGSGSHGAMTGRMLEALEREMRQRKPDWVLVYGDTNSTLAGALAAAKLHIPVAHVEAGLRSYNRAMPEEINRVLTDHLSGLLFAPTQTAVSNLSGEGIEGAKVQMVGDIMYDAALFYRERSVCPSFVESGDAAFILCTLHRAENTDNPERLASILTAIRELADEYRIIMPLHPRTRRIIEASGFPLNQRGVEVVDPVSYLQMIWLLDHCKLVMTDSGGLQKEAYFFNKPCVTMRDETEWVELVHAGANTLTGSNQQAIVDAVHGVYGQPVSGRNSLYGTGCCARSIKDALLKGI